jgi:hypothetical protein
MREIQGQAKTVRELLKDSRYSIDYYQREYKWEQKQIFELIDDLVDAFQDSYDPKHERTEVINYGRYFLGSIILSQRDKKTYIVDGQQRLSSLTLLLIHLRNLQRDHEEPVNISDLIFSVLYGVKSFNLNVPERTPCLEALYDQKPFDETGKSESVQNLVARHRDIESHFPIARPGDGNAKTEAKEEDESGGLGWHALPYFIDWLTDNVHLVVITAYSDDDAYTIFETMNDRGLSLTPTDMLKGYLLANITDDDKRNVANNRWKQRMVGLENQSREASSDFLKAWLRSQYANKIRERKKDARAEEYDKIGTEFHRWVRDNSKRLGLHSSPEYFEFIDRNMDFYGRQYDRILTASRQLVPGLEPICYNATLGFTLQPQVLLAPLRPSDSDDLVVQKMGIVAKYIDILLFWRQWNYRNIAYSGMQYAMFLVMTTARKETSIEGLAKRLHGQLMKEDETFDTESRLGLHQRNSWFIRTLLARITDYIERESGNPSTFLELMDTKAKNRFEIEHIWAAHPELHEDEFEHPSEFWDARNRVGDLLLLPKKFNASFGDKPYEVKRPKYYGQNLLAKSLDPQAYENDPGFLGFIASSGLPFRPHEEFKKADLFERQELYRQIAKQIWDPAALLQGVEA